MADDDMADQYIDDEDDFEWLYVEDTCPLADELAETAIPDPGYAGTNAELDLTWYDFDLYHYWDDLEYGLDPYWDYAGTDSTGEKRKRPGTARGPQGRRAKISLQETSGDSAVFVSMQERIKLWTRKAPVKKGLKSFALLPDWRKRCAEANNIMPAKAMPVEMKLAAEANDDETPEGQRHYDAEAAEDGDEGEWEDEEDDAMDGPALAGGIDMANVDLDTLKHVLRERLGAAGLNGMGEDAFMETLTKMLQGGGDVDEATGDLASTLLRTVKPGQDSGVAGWLSQHGVQLDDDEEEGDDAESVATVEMPESSGSAGKRNSMTLQMSPSDSAIDVAKTADGIKMAMHDGSPKAAKKRLASVAVHAGDDATEKKRKKVAFDVPVSQENASAEQAEDDEEEVGKAEDATDTAVANEAKPNASEVAHAPKPTRAKTRSAKTSAPSEKSASAKTTTAPQAKATDAKPERPLVDPSGPAKATRKRKAQVDEDEPPPQPAKKQTRKATAQTEVGNEPSYARPTRATRARSGK